MGLKNSNNLDMWDSIGVEKQQLGVVQQQPGSMGVSFKGFELA